MILLVTSGSAVVGHMFTGCCWSPVARLIGCSATCSSAVRATCVTPSLHQVIIPAPARAAALRCPRGRGPAVASYPIDSSCSSS
eukprot:5047050-Pyramimonas_sp.AAC.1